MSLLWSWWKWKWCSRQFSSYPQHDSFYAYNYLCADESWAAADVDSYRMSDESAEASNILDFGGLPDTNSSHSRHRHIVHSSRLWADNNCYHDPILQGNKRKKWQQLKSCFIYDSSHERIWLVSRRRLKIDFSSSSSSVFSGAIMDKGRKKYLRTLPTHISCHRHQGQLKNQFSML